MLAFAVLVTVELWVTVAVAEDVVMAVRPP
jgi:hypothetical protein